MSNAKTGLASAFGALLGGIAGAATGYYAATMRPRVRYAAERGSEIEDAMVVGGTTGAILGAFVGGTVSGVPTPPPAPPQLPR